MADAIGSRRRRASCLYSLGALSFGSKILLQEFNCIVAVWPV